jgi:hypothetical protein
MNVFAILARAAILFDTNVGISITSLLGSLGAAGAAVTVTYYFVGFLKNNENGRARIVEEFKDYHSRSQKKFQDHLDRLSVRQQKSQHDFQAQITRMSKSQNDALRDAIVAMGRMENTALGSSATIHGMQKSIGSLRLTVRAIDVLLCDTEQERVVAGGQRPEKTERHLTDR